MTLTLTDSDYWQELANIYLPRYNLPDFTVGCTVEEIQTWLDRLDILLPVEPRLAFTGLYRTSLGI